MKKVLMLILLALQYYHSKSQSILDTSFNNPSLEQKMPRGFSLAVGNPIEDMALQKDGKIIVVGTFEEYNGRKRNRICRILPNGEIDENFITGSGFNAKVDIVKIQNDGKILVAGKFNVYNNMPCAGFIRLNENGTIDKNFVIPTRIEGSINDLLIAEDSKIYIAGRFYKYNNIPVGGIFRLLSDGNMDNSFSIPNGFNGGVSSIAIQKNKILIGGDFTFNLGAGKLISKLTRLTLNGSFDIGYNISGKGFEASGGNVLKVHVQQDDKILVFGNFKKYNDNVVNRFIRLNENGWLDKKFNNNNDFKKFGSVEGVINKIYTTTNGNIFLGGEFESFGNNVRLGFVKLDGQGNVDPRFNDYDLLFEERPVINSFLLLPSGQFVVGGRFTYLNKFKRNSIALLNNDGSISKEMFYITKGLSGPVKFIVPFKGKYLVAGDFNHFDDEVVNSIILINDKGERDNSFYFSSINYDTEAISSIKVLKNNQIVLAGIFKASNSNVTNKLLRVDEKGIIDETFYIGTSFDNYVYTMDEQKDGKLVVGGDFKKIDGITKIGIARINTDGSLDNSFNSNNNLEMYIRNLIVDEETDKITIAGRFNHPTKKVYVNFQKLLPNGNLDNAFNTSLFENTSIQGFTKDNNKRFIVYGSLNTPGKGRTEIIRVDNNGNYDPSFFIDPKFYKYGNYVNKVIVLSNNDLMVGFKSPPSGDQILANNSIIRLNNNGMINNNFKFTTNMALVTRGEMFGTLNGCILLNDDRILVGGYFNYLDGYYIDYLAKLKMSTSTNVTKELTSNITSSKTESANTIALNILAKAIFKGKKTSLSNDEKNLIANEITDFKVGRNGKDYYLINDEEDSKKEDGDLVSINISVFVLDLNDDKKDEVFIELNSSMYGRDGSPIFIYSIINGKATRILNDSGISLEVNTNRKNGYKEIAITSPLGNLKKSDGTKYTIYSFKNEDYQMIGKTNLSTTPKWEKIEKLYMLYQSTLK